MTCGPCGLGWGCFAVQPRQSVRLLFAVKNVHDGVGGIFASVVQLPLPGTLRRCPFEPVLFEQVPRFGVRLAVKNKLYAHCFDVLTVSIAAVLFFDRFRCLDSFQCFNTLFYSIDVGIAVCKFVGREGLAVESQGGNRHRCGHRADTRRGG